MEVRLESTLGAFENDMCKRTGDRSTPVRPCPPPTTVVGFSRLLGCYDGSEAVVGSAAAAGLAALSSRPICLATFLNRAAPSVKANPETTARANCFMVPSLALGNARRSYRLVKSLERAQRRQAGKRPVRVPQRKAPRDC